MEKLLVVIDMQNDFVSGSLGSDMAQKIVSNVTNKIVNHKGLTAFTRDTHLENYLDTQEGKNLPVEHCLKDSKGWEIIDELKNFVTEETPVFDKPSFGSVELGNYVSELYSKGVIDEVILIGLCTDICVISNAMVIKAMQPEIPITVDSSCCAGVSVETHDSALVAMKTCQINII